MIGNSVLVLCALSALQNDEYGKWKYRHATCAVRLSDSHLEYFSLFIDFPPPTSRPVETSTLSLVNSQSSSQASVAMVSSSTVETELRRTVLPNTDITITTLSPLSASSIENRETTPPTTTSSDDDDDDRVTPSQRATAGSEVATTTTAATEIPNLDHENPLMDQAGNLPHSPAANNIESPDKIEEDGSQQNIPVLNVDVNDLIPSLQNEGLAQIKIQFPKDISLKFHLFLLLNFYLTSTVGVPQAQQFGSCCKF